MLSIGIATCQAALAACTASAGAARAGVPPAPMDFQSNGSSAAVNTSAPNPWCQRLGPPRGWSSSRSPPYVPQWAQRLGNPPNPSQTWQNPPLNPKRRPEGRAQLQGLRLQSRAWPLSHTDTQRAEGAPHPARQGPPGQCQWVPAAWVSLVTVAR